jgi:hypothetical protein
MARPPAARGSDEGKVPGGDARSHHGKEAFSRNSSGGRELSRAPQRNHGCAPAIGASKEAAVRQGWESFKVKGDDLVRRVRELLHEGNVRRVVVKQGPRTVAEFPVTVGIVGALAAPALAALGALAALLSECTIEVERGASPAAAPPAPRSPVRRVPRKRA